MFQIKIIQQDTRYIKVIIIPTDRKICHFHYHSAYKHFCFTSKIINLPPYNLSHNFQCLYITNWYYKHTIWRGYLYESVKVYNILANVTAQLPLARRPSQLFTLRSVTHENWTCTILYDSCCLLCILLHLLWMEVTVIIYTTNLLTMHAKHYYFPKWVGSADMCFGDFSLALLK